MDRSEYSVVEIVQLLCFQGSGVVQLVERLTHKRSVESSKPVKAPVVSLSKNVYSHDVVLVDSRNGFGRYLHKQNNPISHLS